MNVFQADCPYCGTKKVMFTILSETGWGKPNFRRPDEKHYDTFAICGYCHRGIVATFITPDGQPPSKTPHSRLLLKIAPPPPDTGAPSHTPQNVARFFEQAMDNLPKNWDAAGSMFRKALDTGLKSKFPEMKGDLKARIKKAEEKQMLTPELAEWAHQIRDLGNEAAHEEEPFSKKDAKELAAFTHLVFQYLFTLPGMLRKARGDPDEAKVGKDQE